jgi:hypothetical protein
MHSCRRSAGGEDESSQKYCVVAPQERRSARHLMRQDDSLMSAKE